MFRDCPCRGTGGFAVTCVTNSREAVAVFLESPTDLVILEMIMPGVDGTKVLRGILASGIAARFVLMTADGIGDAYLGIAQGMARYHGLATLPVLSKPFRPPELIGLLRQVPGG